MKDVSYTLKTEVNGVKELLLRAPTRKQLKFAASVKSSFMSVAMKMAEKMKDTTPSEKDADKKLNGADMLAALYAGEVDVGTLLERFQSACTKSPMCQMNGGDVPDDFWNDITMEDTEGLFAEFLGNFITI